MNKRMTALWFVLGLGSQLQVVASLSFTEAIVLMVTPFVIIHDYHQLKKDGLLPLFLLSFMVVVGCIIGSIANHTPREYVLRGLAVTCIICCAIVFSHWLIRRDPGGFKWYVLAVPFSAILSTFVFRSASEVASLGDSVEGIVSGPLFWIRRIKPLVWAPILAWYIHIPRLISVLVPMAFAVFAMLISISGRSTAIGALGFAAFALIGGRSRKSISIISRHFWSFVVVGFILVGVIYGGYKVSAMQGWLGEDARAKFEMQTYGGEGGLGRLILSGRSASFVGLLACRDKPIIGWGPWPRDEGGYTLEFMKKYGTYEDYQYQIAIQEWHKKNGRYELLLSCHSYITEFWAWYGIAGLVFWVYVIFVLLRYLKQDVAVVPQWFAWLACSLPSFFWAIFFSGMVDRVGTSMFIVACLMARAVRTGRFMLPEEMIREIELKDKK